MKSKKSLVAKSGIHFSSFFFFIRALKQIFAVGMSRVGGTRPKKKKKKKNTLGKVKHKEVKF